jgi:xylulokinase
LSQFLVGIDIGSGGCKATALNVESGVSYTQASEYPTYYPRPGWAEQNPSDWIDRAGIAIKSVIEKAGISPSEVKAVCIGGVTHSPVFLGEKGEIVRPTINLTDTRSTAQVEKLMKKTGDLILKISLNQISVMWTLPMLIWVRENEHEIWSRVRKIVFPKDYVRFRLIGKVVTDYIDAQGSLLFDPVNNTWSRELLELSGIDVDLLPEVVGPSEVVGEVSEEGAAWSGLAVGTSVIAGATDTALEVYSAGAVNPGDCTVKLATFGRICAVTREPVSGKGLVTYSHLISGLWYPGTGTKSCASSLRWFRDEFCRDMGEDAFSKMDDEAGKIAAGSNGLVFHPYLLGEGSPYADPMLRGDFVGLTLHHGRGHLIRSVMEGVAFSILDSLLYLESFGIRIQEPLRFIGGGTKSQVWLSILTDVLGRKAILPAATDPSYGAALLAGVRIGLFDGLEAALKVNRVEPKELFPSRENAEVYKGLFKIYKEIHDQLVVSVHALSKDFS